MLIFPFPTFGRGLIVGSARGVLRTVLQLYQNIKCHLPDTAVSSRFKHPRQPHRVEGNGLSDTRAPEKRKQHWEVG